MERGSGGSEGERVSSPRYGLRLGDRRTAAGRGLYTRPGGAAWRCETLGQTRDANPRRAVQTLDARCKP